MCVPCLIRSGFVTNDTAATENPRVSATSGNVHTQSQPVASERLQDLYYGLSRNAHAGDRTRVTSMGGLYEAATLHALVACNIRVAIRDVTVGTIAAGICKTNQR